jgi:hypothetical protein
MTVIEQALAELEASLIRVYVGLSLLGCAGFVLDVLGGLSLVASR